MESLSDYRALVAVVDAGSVRGAAAATGMPRSTISRALKRLGDRLGVLLTMGDQGELHITPEGRRLAGRARGFLADIAASEAALKQDARSQPLVVSIPASGRNPRLHSLLTSFAAAHPELPLEARATNAFVDLRAEAVDVAIRAGRGADAADVVVPLMSVRWALVASDGYAATRGLPQTPEELADHPLLLPSQKTPPNPWPLATPWPVGARVALTTNDLSLLRAAVSQHLGVALLNQVGAELGTGLVAVLPRWWSEPHEVSAVYPSERRSDSRVRAFVAHAKAFLGS